MAVTRPRRIGFFTRLLDQATAGERYRLATEQIVHAERHGFDSAWVAQHHFDGDEGGLPAPLVFLAYVSARTSRIRLGTGIVTLPLDEPVRVAEDAAVLDLILNGRLELARLRRHAIGFCRLWARHRRPGVHFRSPYDHCSRRARREAAWRRKHSLSRGVTARRSDLAGDLLGRRGERAGAAGDGLMLSRAQPRPKGTPDASLADLQHPIIDAYLAALPHGREPRIMASRTLFVADDRKEALRLADIGLSRVIDHLVEIDFVPSGRSLSELIAALDMHIGTPDDVIPSLRADSTLDRVTDLVFQVHSVDPPHAHILRSIELIAKCVAPALGWEQATVGKGNRVAFAS
jgi:alkanesulfonate monooxygenase SsuD/methylene tetrahydromethanopterin reductase-like flavin-dependent oxidoreductase (luciferase family)